MALLERLQSIIVDLCTFLGRHNVWSRWLDRCAGWILITTPAAAPAIGPPRYLMGSGPGTDDEGSVLPAPASPHAGPTGSYEQPDDSWWLARLLNWSKTVHASTACSEAKYHGMHGTPCRFAGGTDLKCPSGTVSGWFWRYKTSVGVIYYVDCCGKNPTSGAPWCNWTNEPNWCLGGKAAARGISQYTCTLTIPAASMRVNGSGQIIGAD